MKGQGKEHKSLPNISLSFLSKLPNHTIVIYINVYLYKAVNRKKYNILVMRTFA